MWGDDVDKNRTKNLGKLFDSIKKMKISSLFSMKVHPHDNLIGIFNFSFLSKILVIESALLTCKDLFGEEIYCSFHDPSQMSKKKATDYCWIDGGYTVLPTENFSPYAGVTSSVQTDDGSKFYHRYYQWVYISLIIQSVMFFSLKWVWNRLLDRRFVELIGKLDQDRKNLYEYNKPDQMFIVQSVADLLSTGFTFYYNVILIEILCLIHLIFQIWITNRFLNGNFIDLGIVWLNSTYAMKSITSLFRNSASTGPENSALRAASGDISFSNSFDPLQMIFPRMVKCTLKFYGLTGDINSYDGLCFLAANSLHEKIYLCQWFLYHFFLILTILVIIYRALVHTFPPFRYIIFSFKYSHFITKSYRRLLKSPSNWFFLYSLSSIMSNSYFIDLMDAVVVDHFDKHGKPLYCSAFGHYAMQNKELQVDRSFELAENKSKVVENKDWCSWENAGKNINNKK